RWYDLRRRHMAGEIDLTNWDFSSARSDFEFTEDNLVFPIPTNEVVQNPNLTQNTGY
ncbi:MAG: RagB/SusD family nutrient uptake outer membrane protein, partial [Tangfeifania sp.]